MKIKRYVVREMQEAIKLIKQDLGPEALIVSSYKVLAKGFLGFFSPRLLEVTAVLDDNPDSKTSLKAPPAQITAGAGNSLEKQISPSNTRPGTIITSQQTSQVREKELDPALAGRTGLAGQSLHYRRQMGIAGGFPKQSLLDEDKSNWYGEEKSRLFDTLVSKHIEDGMPGDPAQWWRKTLLDMDVQENIAERLVSFLRDGNHLENPNCQDLIVNLFQQIARLLEPAYRSREYARVLTFVGPSGVGKTTTLAKLATRLSLYENKKVALVAVYAYRFGAVEQLQAYGAFLGIPVEVVMTPAELAKVLEMHGDKDYILIDTVGCSAGNAGKLLELKGFLDVVEEPRDIFLVLSLTTKNRDLNRIAGEFRKLGYSKLIFTKVDETETYGAILNLVCASGLPVAYLADGQGIPDDICEAGPKKIARLLLSGVDPDEVVAI